MPLGILLRLLKLLVFVTSITVLHPPAIHAQQVGHYVEGITGLENGTAPSPCSLAATARLPTAWPSCPAGTTWSVFSAPRAEILTGKWTFPEAQPASYI